MFLLNFEHLGFRFLSIFRDPRFSKSNANFLKASGLSQNSGVVKLKYTGLGSHYVIKQLQS